MKTITLTTKPLIVAAVLLAVEKSIAFSVTPLPNDCYELSIKPEALHFFNHLLESKQTKSTSTDLTEFRKAFPVGLVPYEQYEGYILIKTDTSLEFNIYDEDVYDLTREGYEFDPVPYG